MADIAVELVSVERSLWSGTAKTVMAQTPDGEIGIRAGHQPMLAELIPSGTVTIRTSDGSTRIAAVHGGFLSVTGPKVTILAESADWAEDIDVTTESRILDSSEPGSEDHLVARGRLRAAEKIQGIS